MAIVAVSIAPTGEGASVGGYVAEALRVLQTQEAVGYELGSMFTTLEGDLDEVMALIRRMQEAVFDAGAVRVGTVLKIDDRRDKAASIDDKLQSVRDRLSAGREPGGSR